MTICSSLQKKGESTGRKCMSFPEGGKNTQGRAIQNLIQIERDDEILNILNAGKLTTAAYHEGRYVLFATERGRVKKTPLVAYSKPRVNGILAITIQPEDRLLATELVQAGEHIILALRSGKAIRFPEKEVRSMGRTAAGVRGITLGGKEDKVVSLVTTAVHEAVNLLAVAAKGYGKRSKLEDYRVTHRAGKGVKALQITNKTGFLTAVKVVAKGDDLIIINTSGIAIRMDTGKISLIGRATQGVRLIELRGADQIADVEIIPSPPEEIPSEA